MCPDCDNNFLKEFGYNLMEVMASVPLPAYPLIRSTPRLEARVDPKDETLVNASITCKIPAAAPSGVTYDVSWFSGGKNLNMSEILTPSGVEMINVTLMISLLKETDLLEEVSTNFK